MSQKNTSTSTSKFQFDGGSGIKEAVPLGLQYVLTMSVGNIIPMILIASAASLPVQNVNTLPQCCMSGAVISTATQLYPTRIENIQTGSGFPCMMRLTYVFLLARLSTAGSRGVPYIFGAQTTASVITVSYGTLFKRMSSSLPLVVTGTIIMTVDVSIFNPATGNIAGGTSSSDSEAPIDWTVGVFVVLVVLGFNVFGKGLPKVAAILVGMTANYILSVILGLVSPSSIGEAAQFAFPGPFAFGIKFGLRCTLMFVLPYFIAAMQIIGDFNVSCTGGLDREPTPDKIEGRVTANEITSTISAMLNSFPTVAYSRNSDIVAPIRACPRFVILVGCGVPFLTGLYPKVGTVLSTIPNRATGGGTVIVSTIIVTSGTRLLTKAGYSNRNCLITSVFLAFGLGTQFCKGANAQFPAGIAAMLEENSVILTFPLAVILSLAFLKDPAQAEGPADKVQ